jgi:hypothetical protein
MANNRYVAIAALSVGVLGTTASLAQTDTTGLSMTTEFVGTQINLVKDANKISSWPEVKDNIVEIPPITYHTLPNKLNVTIEPQIIKPAKVNVEPPLKKLYRGYVRAGFGLYTTPLAELYYMDGRSRNGTYSVYAKHLSSAGGVALDKDIPDSFSRNEVHLWGKRFVKKHALEGGFDWERDVVHFYGFDPTLYTDVDYDKLQQSFNNIDGYVQLKSYFRDTTKVNYVGKVMFSNYSDNYQGTENNLDINGTARKIIEREIYNADLNLNYNQFEYQLRDGTERLRSNDRFIFDLKPTVTSIRNNFKAILGANIVLGDKDQFAHFYPIAEVNYSLLDDLFIPYAGITGGLEAPTYKSLTHVNPWLITDIADPNGFTNVSNKIEAYGGIRGTISSSASFNLTLRWNDYENFIYFVNDSLYSPGNQFQIVQDELTVTTLTGEVSVTTTDNFNLLLRGDYYIYDSGIQAHAWNQPNTKVSLSATYKLQDKFLATAEVFAMGKRRAQSLVAVEGVDPQDDGTYEVELKGFADINFQLEYRYTQRLSAFVRLNNMFASKYAMWNNYTVQRFNAMLGATYSF